MNLAHIESAIEPYKKQLLEHTLYEKIKTPKDLQVFMEHHVFAVWDFMSLLKSLQSSLTHTSFPWYPVGNPELRYLINEIVLAEETDINLDGKRQSHYEMYLDAMQKSEANTEAIHNFVDHIQHGTDIYLVIASSDIPASIKKFLKFSFDVIYSRKPHLVAAAFTFGRENLIPAMFTSIIEKVQRNFPEQDLSLFKYYFDRHIELDEDEHGPMALQMVKELCENDEQKWKEAETISIESLQHRIMLWDGIEESISS
ncbi:DUF3050 domain-containing protein [Mesonia sp. K4-1]|uniref:DUF3050 domain-containing protein n=1 Tax=Mesonia sp. K4-1 TaxID=2602760 RepID=UPI0011CCD91B|nr:DUF3050 domain-containing protein [Mesonia sp. K4-1]TXK76674.1 DUF3050 domain-containing protein [Mesonia sp. K4-1]